MMAEPDLSIDGLAQELVGRTIGRVEMDSKHQRTYGLTLIFTDGSRADLGVWAHYAEDMGLELILRAAESSD